MNWRGGCRCRRAHRGAVPRRRTDQYELRPDEALPDFADDLQLLAAGALDRVVGEASELAELWDETPQGSAWRHSISRIRAASHPNPSPSGTSLSAH
ncbi:DUF4259 domain-containing protein [Streptomyces sp. B21-097]|uniref:DUF4259 domain-containing protein n=1 Tax=Streptomyces sp. B21-097 TaxID=3039414 RepID=UPI003FA71E29